MRCRIDMDDGGLGTFIEDVVSSALMSWPGPYLSSGRSDQKKKRLPSTFYFLPSTFYLLS
jgi:hypothetical protein